MAANLEGMFAQLNQGIQQNPLVTGAGQGLLDGASQGLGGALGTALGRDPYSFMNEGAKQRQGIEELAAIEDMTTSQGLMDASAVYGKMGQISQQVAMAQTAQTQRLAEEKLQKEQKLRETLVKTLNKHDMGDYAEQVSTGAVDLADASKIAQEAERDSILLTRGIPGRKVIAKQHGITAEEFDELGLGAIEEDAFKNFTQGIGAESKPFMDAQGKPFIGRVNKSGKVWDKDAVGGSGAWRNPSEMGLQPAPTVQKVINQTQDLVKAYGDASVDNYVDLHTKANDAVDMLNNVNRAKGYLEDMVVGPGASISLMARRLAMAWGGDPDAAAANSDTYLAEAGMRVAEIIKNFGSGTGLSDADREYAAKIAAGDVTVTPEAIKKLLEIQGRGAQNTVDFFKETDKAARKRLGEDQSVLDTFVIKPVHEVEQSSNKLMWVPGKGWQ